MLDLLDVASDNRVFKCAEKLFNKLNKGKSEEIQEILDMYLEEAVEERDLVWAEVFLRNGANPNTNLTGHDMPVLAWAMLYDSEIGKKLVDFGADVNAKSPYDETALMFVAKESRYDNDDLFYLIEHGADINLADKNGKTAMMYALDGGNLGGFYALADHGADLLAKDKEGKSVLDYAREAKGAGKLKPENLKEIEKKIAEAELKKVDAELATIGGSQKPKVAPKVADSLER